MQTQSNLGRELHQGPKLATRAKLAHSGQPELEMNQGFSYTPT